MAIRNFQIKVEIEKVLLTCFLSSSGKFGCGALVFYLKFIKNILDYFCTFINITLEKEGSMKDFNVGDIVKVKSGGPKMTVDQITHKGEVSCTWFSGSKMQTGYFHPETLQKVEEVDE